MKEKVIKIMLGWIEHNEPIETTADKLLDLFEEIKLPTDEEISNEASELNALTDANGRIIFKYAFDDNEKDAFITGATWVINILKKG